MIFFKKIKQKIFERAARRELFKIFKTETPRSHRRDDHHITYITASYFLSVELVLVGISGKNAEGAFSLAFNCWNRAVNQRAKDGAEARKRKRDLDDFSARLAMTSNEELCERIIKYKGGSYERMMREQRELDERGKRPAFCL